MTAYPASIKIARENSASETFRRESSTSLLRAEPWLVVLAIVVLAADNYADPDLWRHLLVGRIVLETRRLPLTDTFSYTAFGLPWRQHEWLADTIMAALYNGFGVVGLKVLKLACAAATISLLAMGMTETGAPARVQRSILVVIALALAPQMQFRPQLFSYVMLTLLFALMAAETYGGRSVLWVAIPAFALWANLHGGFAVGLAALALYAGAVTVRDLTTQRGLGRGARLVAITAACAVATLVNPLGIAIWSNVMHSLSDPFVKGAIAEWRPLPSMLAEQIQAWSPGAVIYLVPLGLFAALAVCFLMAPAIEDAPMVAMSAVLVFSAFYAVRNMALAVIAVAIPLTRHAGMLARRRRRNERSHSGDDARGFNPAVAAALAVMLALFGGVASDRLKLGLDCPEAAVAFMQEHHLSGNILCDFKWGEYLMWHLGPRSRVFIDGRWELLYPHNVMEDYITFDRGKAGAEAVLDGYPNDFVLVSPGSKAYRVVMSDRRWKIIYRDAIGVLFARAAFTIAGAVVRANAAHVNRASPGLFP